MIHLPTLRAKRQLQNDLDRRLAEREPMTPRAAAVELLQQKIAAGQAGLDSYDASAFIVELGANERKWGTIAVNLCGWPTDRREHPGGGVRLYAVLEADVRVALGLDEAGAALMVEPLASRAAPVALVDATLAALAPSPQIVAGEPVSLAAIRAAKDAYDRRAITLTIDATCPACRGTGGGVYNDCPTCGGNGVVA